MCGFGMQNNDFRSRIRGLNGSQTSPMVFYIQNSDFSTRISSLYGSQPSAVVFCIHNSDIMTRINSLSGSQTSPVVVCMQKKSRLASELLVSMGPSLHLWFLHPKLRLYDLKYKSLLVPHLTHVIFAFKTATLWPELIVSLGPRPPLSFCAFKTV